MGQRLGNALARHPPKRYSTETVRSQELVIGRHELHATMLLACAANLSLIRSPAREELLWKQTLS